MKRLLSLVVAFLLIGVPAAVAQAAEAVEVSELLEDSAAYSGEITISGELIGDYGFRSDGSMWSQLNGDRYVTNPVLEDGGLAGGNVGVAVRIPAVLAAELDPPGGYRVRGPVVAVVGIWKYHDPDRGGESYVDVTSLIVVEPGRELVEHPNYLVLFLGGVLVIGAAVVRQRSKDQSR